MTTTTVYVIQTTGKLLNKYKGPMQATYRSDMIYYQRNDNHWTFDIAGAMLFTRPWIEGRKKWIARYINTELSVDDYEIGAYEIKPKATKCLKEEIHSDNNELEDLII